MKIGIHQPNFLPWYPFFQKINDVDIFIILKEPQFEKNNFQNRFNLNDEWYTMSVHKGMMPIKNKEYFNPQKDWEQIKKKLHNYENILSEFDEFITNNLFETNYSIITKMLQILDLKTQIVLDYPTELKSTDRLIDLCKTYNATSYLSGLGGNKYLDLEKFEKENINVEFQTDLNKIHSLQYIKENL